MTRTTASAGGWRDLALVGVLAGAAAIALLVPGVPRPVEWALGLPFLVALPGYAFVSAMFPETPVESTADADGEARGGPQWPVRVATSLVASVLVVATVAIVLSATVGIRLVPAVVGIVLVTGAFLLLAGVRRSLRPATRRAAPLGRGRLVAPQWFGATSLQRVTLLLALVALLSAVAVASAYPTGDEGYTEFYVLDETEDGELVAADYQTDVAAGSAYPVHLGIENAADERQTYDVLVRGQPDRSGADAERLDRFQVQVDGGDRAVLERSVVPRQAADRTRLQFLLYEDGVPDDPSEANADAALHLWVEVTQGGGG